MLTINQQLFYGEIEKSILFGRFVNKNVIIVDTYSHINFVIIDK
jgi:hypothetical protein